nr:hypothetical protein [Tanacetum cinerariifolium]
MLEIGQRARLYADRDPGHLLSSEICMTRQGRPHYTRALMHTHRRCDEVKEENKQLRKEINMLMKVVRSDDKFSQLLTQLQSQHEVGSGSGSGGGREDESSKDEDVGEDEDADGGNVSHVAGESNEFSHFESLTYDLIGKDCAKITKKQSNPDKIEHEIAKNAQKPDQRTFSVQVIKSKSQR